MSKQVLGAIARKAHAGFIYTHDQQQYGVIEDWRIPVLDPQGEFRGDCDDFALHIFDEGRKAGLDMRVVVLSIPTREGWGGHAVAYCESLNLIADNMNTGLLSPSWYLNVRWQKMSQINDLREWFEAKFNS